MKAWKVWLALFAVCEIAVLLKDGRLPPRDPLFGLELSLVTATEMLVAFGVAWRERWLEWPWTAWWEERRWRKTTDEFAASEFGQWLREQERLRERGEEIPPPWTTDFEGPELGPMHIGWRQGYGEAWIKEIWHPFWLKRTPAHRREYLNRWEAPEIWRSYLDPDRPEARATLADKYRPATFWVSG